MITTQTRQQAYKSSAGEHDQNTLQTELIRKMQVLQGDEPCFATDKSHDCAEICQWRRNCRKHVAAWLR
jgi:hypothetical protein